MPLQAPAERSAWAAVPGTKMSRSASNRSLPRDDEPGDALAAGRPDDRVAGQDLDLGRSRLAELRPDIRLEPQVDEPDVEIGRSGIERGPVGRGAARRDHDAASRRDGPAVHEGPDALGQRSVGEIESGGQKVRAATCSEPAEPV